MRYKRISKNKSTILFFYKMTNELFDPSSTYFYISVSYYLEFDMNCDIIDSPIHIIL